MEAVRRMLCRLLTEQRGATAIEYGVLAALIAMTMIGALTALGGGAGGMWTDVSTEVAAAT